MHLELPLFVWFKVVFTRYLFRLKRDLSAILENLQVDESNSANNNVLVLIISLVTASLRSLKVTDSSAVVLCVACILS